MGWEVGGGFSSHSCLPPSVSLDPSSKGRLIFLGSSHFGLSVAWLKAAM